MRILKKIAIFAWIALLSGTTLWGQPDMSKNKVVKGSKGEMIVFYGLQNWQEIYLSRNGRFVFGKNGNEGFIYELATREFEYIEDGYVVAVEDWDKYITSNYAQMGNDICQDYTRWNRGSEDAGGNDFRIVAASEDLNTLMAVAYMSTPGTPQLTLILDTKTGDILDTLEFFDIDFETEKGIVSTGMAMSGDGKIIAGRATMPRAYSNFSAALWDRERGSINYTGTEGEVSDGELAAISTDGSFAVGANDGYAYIVRYDKAKGTFTTENIPRWPNNTQAHAWGVSDNHVVIGAEGMEAQDRTPYLYFADTKTKYNLHDYCHYLYGLDVEKEIDLYTPMSLSSDARIFTGYTAAGSFYPYVVILDAEQAFAPALDVQAQQNLGTDNVQVRWSAPLTSEYTVLGYNVYRGQTKVNSTMVAANQNTYLDMGVSPNTYWYSVEAVYDEGTAPKSDSVSIYVINPNGCLPVQNIYKNVVYNRTVQLDWDLPSSDLSLGRRAAKGAAGDVYPAGFFQPQSYMLSAAVKVGDYIYTTTRGGIFTIYDAYTHKALKTADIPMLATSTIYDMTYHDGTFWLACNSSQIIELTLGQDPLEVSMGRYWSTRIANVTHIAYVENQDPSVNEGDDYLILGGYESVVRYPVTARGANDMIPGGSTGLTSLIIGGSECHDGKLYITDQSGVNGCDLITFDLATGEEIHRQNLFENARIAEYVGGDTKVSYPLGLTKTTLNDGTVVLECLMQSSVNPHFVVDLEIEASSSVLGYRVYRNDKPVSDTLISRHFEEDLLDEGTYVYSIEYLDKKGCSSNSSEVNATVTVEINAIGECNPPTDLKARESNSITVLTWEIESTAGLVGFNVYRDGSLISEPRLADKKFYDVTAEMDKEYMYVVEAFYDNSCVASDTVTITLNGKGTAEAPSAVKVTGMLHEEEDGKFDVIASWNLPFFEEPMAYGYCKNPYSANSIGDASEVYCVIGWDAEDMAKFDEDLYLVGVEFMLGTKQVENVRTLIYVDDQQVHQQIYDDKLNEWEWCRSYFTKIYRMKQKQEIGVGYAVSYNPEEVQSVFAYDAGPGKPQYSDLVSGNGEQFDYLGRMDLDVNLCINALVVRQRDLEAAASAPNPQAYIAGKAVTMDAALKLSGRGAVAPEHARKTTSDGIKLRGFNVYRDDEKINETLLTGFEYTDANLSQDKDEYEYRVSAVYDGAEEQFSDYMYVYTSTLDNETEAKDAGVSVYPNPSAGAFNLQMTYNGMVEIYDMTGRIVLRREMTSGVHGLSLDHSGVYMVRVLTNGKTVTMKLVVR